MLVATYNKITIYAMNIALELSSFTSFSDQCYQNLVQNLVYGTGYYLPGTIFCDISDTVFDYVPGIREMIKPAIGVFLQLSRSSFGGWPKETHESQCFHFYPCKDQKMKVLICLAVGGPSFSYGSWGHHCHIWHLSKMWNKLLIICSMLFIPIRLQILVAFALERLPVGQSWVGRYLKDCIEE